MKNTIKKAEMRGQWMDMQKTRGGIPARLREVTSNVAHKNMLWKNGIRYIVGRTGWFPCKSPTPIEKTFIHYTDEKKAEIILQFVTACDDAVCYWGKEAEKQKSAEKAKELQNTHQFDLTPKYKKLLKSLWNK